jgi:tetratricopeptide (TPR) repeat protein
MTGSEERLKSDETNSNEISSAEVQRARLEAEVQRARLEAERAKLEAEIRRAKPKKVWPAITVGLLLTVIIVASLVYILVNAYTTAHRNDLAELAAQVDLLKSAQQSTATPQQSDVEILKIKVESELEASRNGIEAMRDVNDRNFVVFAIIGGVATAFGFVTLVTTWFKGRQEHQDYKDERKFYEDRATEYETRRKDEHKAILQLYGEQLKARQDENKYAGRMFALQEANLKEVNTITTAIAAGAKENVESLNTILSTFREIMEFRAAEAGKVKNLTQQVEDLQGHLEKLERAQQQQRDELEKTQRQRVEELLQRTVRLRHPRHIYASPDPDLKLQIEGYRTQMDFMEPATLDQYTGVESPAQNRRYGEIYLRRGVIAYCDNDVLKSREMLRIAERFFPFSEQEIESMSLEQKLPTAFTQYYLALIEKNYGDMTAAREYIERSYAVYGRNEPQELLTPTTRAEILSYLEDMDDARAAIKEVLDRANNLRRRAPLKRNDAISTLRARLLLGNTYYVSGDWQQALQHYQDALEADVQRYYSYYVYHSIAQVYHQLGDEKKAKENKRQTYKELVDTGHLQTKVALDTQILLNALAYLCTCEDEPEKAKDYRGTVQELWLRIREVNDLQLRLFSFKKKQQISKDEFWAEVFSG